MHGIIRQPRSIYLIAIFISILLSYFASIREFVINADAICYLQSAQTLPSGLSTAMHLCDQAKWPFYPILIFGLASLTKISYINSAFVLNSFFSLISVITFIGIIQFLKNTPRILWLAAIVILLAHEFNAVKEYIIRDHGFWAFYLLSILFLLHYFRTSEWRYALGWSVSLVIATLFRIEGIVFLCTLPFAVFFNQGSFAVRFRSFLQLNSILLSILFLLGTWFIFHPQQAKEYLVRIIDLKATIIHGFYIADAQFHKNVQILGQQILNKYSSHDASLILFLVMMFWYTISFLGNLSIIYAILVVYAWRRKLLALDSSVKLVLLSYIIVNLLVTIGFLFENLFLSKRYLLALSLIFMIWVPFALDNLFQQWQKYKLPLLLVLFLMLVSGIGGIFNFGHSKKYLREASQWLEYNLPSNAVLFTNDIHLKYYSKHFGNEIFTKNENRKSLDENKLKNYDYIALRFNKKTVRKFAELRNKLGTPVQVFKNKRGDAVYIYKLHQEAK